MRHLTRAAIATLLASLGLVALGGAFLLLHLRIPSDGARLPPGASAITPMGVRLEVLRGEAGALQDGDLVIAAAGRSLEAWARALFTGGVARPTYVPGETVLYTVLRHEDQLDVPVSLGTYPLAAIVGRSWGTILFAGVYMAVAAFVFLRRPNDRPPQLLLLSAAAILSATTWSLGLAVSDFTGALGFWLFKATTLGAYMLFWIAGLHFALCFPQPLHPRFERRGMVLALYALPYLLLPVVLFILWLNALSALDWLGKWSAFEGLHAAVFLTLTLVAIAWQYRASAGQARLRQQARWIILGAALAGAFGLLFYVLPGVLWDAAVDPNFMGAIILIFPVSIAIAVLRHNLFDVDLLFNRALVYGALTLSTMGLYVLIVGYLGNLLQANARGFLAFVTTGLIAVLFQPLRDRLQSGVNRLMYGERDDPHAVLARLGRRLEAAVSPEAVLPTVVQTVADSLKIPYAAILMDTEAGEEMAAEYGRPVAAPLRLPLAYQNEPVGALLVAPRAPGEPFSAADHLLLENIAHHAGTAVYSVRLTEQLRHSRRRIVSAREEERRRLRRDLHDGLGPQLASQALGLEALSRYLDSDPQRARELVNALLEPAREAVRDIRRIVYDLRPPALDELGLAGALRTAAPDNAHPVLAFNVMVPEPLPPLPAAVEVAAYRIGSEALANVLRHSGATCCTLTLETTAELLVLEVVDDGRGIPATARTGVGLLSMQERAAELNGRCVIGPAPGGGTRVRAELPLR